LTSGARAPTIGSMIRNPENPAASETTVRIRRIAVSFRDWLRGSMRIENLEFNDAGVLAVHTILTMKRGEILKLGGAETGRWVVGLGAFLGECIRTRFGGRYRETPAGGVELHLAPDATVSPMSWVQSVLEGGDRSVLARYQALAAKRGGKSAR
jgi:hypothetical protein